MSENEKKEELVYTDSTAKKDLDARLNSESDPPVFNKAENPTYVDEDGFVGVDPIYANAAVETDEPIEAEEGPDADAEDAFADAQKASTNEVPEDFTQAHEKVTRPDVPGAESTASSPASTGSTSSSASTQQESSQGNDGTQA